MTTCWRSAGVRSVPEKALRVGEVQGCLVLTIVHLLYKQHVGSGLNAVRHRETH